MGLFQEGKSTHTVYLIRKFIVEFFVNVITFFHFDIRNVQIVMSTLILFKFSV